MFNACENAVDPYRLAQPLIFVVPFCLALHHQNAQYKALAHMQKGNESILPAYQQACYSVLVSALGMIFPSAGSFRCRKESPFQDAEEEKLAYLGN